MQSWPLHAEWLCAGCGLRGVIASKTAKCETWGEQKFKTKSGDISTLRWNDQVTHSYKMYEN